MLAYVNQPDKAKGEPPGQHLWWAIHDGGGSRPTCFMLRSHRMWWKKAEVEYRKFISYQGQPLLQLP